MRSLRAVAAVAALACMLAGVEAVHPFPSPLLAAQQDEQSPAWDQPAVAGAAPLHLRQAGYTIWASPRSAEISLTSPGGRLYTSLPLAALVGRDALPDGATARTTLRGGGLHTVLRAGDGSVLVDATLRPSAQSFTVSFAAAPGPDRSLEPAFFSDGARGLAMSTIREGFTPDARRPSVSLAPSVSTAGRTPFAPPPFDVELRADPGWMGIGLVQVPDATTMQVGRDGAVRVDYPIADATTMPDLGAGPPDGHLLHFPDFVVTFAPDPLTGLRAYHDALAGLHTLVVAAPPGTRPSWWSDPLVDTWGEQMATRAQRSSPLFTADWVLHFVKDWHARYHVPHVTVVIDSRWQERIGDSMPDVARFGGMSGMRTLIDRLHALGDHVLLWWPMWAHLVDHIPMSARQARLATADHVIDPTAPEFASEMATTVGDLLGGGAGQLDADGLKLDWQYDIPQTLARPELAWGARALYRYLDAIHTAAHQVRPDAMVDASAAAPQFASVVDTVRLYDAWSAAEWDRRAAIVAAADPDVLIDGDGWQTDTVDAVPHAVASAVYGTPAVYFDSTWVGGVPISAALAAQLGEVVALAPLKGQGRAMPLPDGEWQYVVAGTVTARTFDAEHALVVRSPVCAPTWRETVATAAGGRLLVPIEGRRLLGAVDSAGRRATATRTSRGVLLTARPGGLYFLTFSGGC